MAWFPWRKKRSEDETLDEVTPVEPLPVPATEPLPAPAAQPTPVEPVAPVAPAAPAEPPAPAPAETSPAPELPAPAPISPTTPPPAAGAPVWNPNLGGVVVRLRVAEASDAGAATDLRTSVEAALAAAVGPDSPAPADAPEDHPIVVQLTIAEEIVDADTDAAIAAMRKQLARKAERVRLVVDQVPRAEL